MPPFLRVVLETVRLHGFHQEGILRKAGYQGGEYCDVHVFGILKHEIEEERKNDVYEYPFERAEGDVSEPT